MLPLAEEADEGAVVGFAGEEFDGVGASGAEGVEEGLALAGVAGEEGAAGGGIGGIDGEASAGFGVLEIDEADGGQGLFAFIADDQVDEIVAAGGDAQQALAGGGDEVGEQERDRAAADDMVEILEGGGEVGARRRGAGGKDVGDDAQDVGDALGGGDVFFNPIGKQDQSDAVVVGDGREGEDGGNTNTVLNTDSEVQIVNTLIEPISYNDYPMKSSDKLVFYFDSTTQSIKQLRTDQPDEVDNFIVVPSKGDSSDDSFEYSAELDFSMYMYPEFDASKWLSKGANITLGYNKSQDIFYADRKSVV